MRIRLAASEARGEAQPSEANEAWLANAAVAAATAQEAQRRQTAEDAGPATGVIREIRSLGQIDARRGVDEQPAQRARAIA